MEVLIAVVLGAFVGWLASLVMDRDPQQGWIGNIVVGIIGSFLGGVISKGVTGRDQAELGEFSWEALLWSFVGAVLLLAVVNLFQRRTLR